MAAAPRVGSIPHFSRNSAKKAPRESTSAGTWIVDHTGTSTCTPGIGVVGTSPGKRRWSANQTARFRITPTTAAVIAESAAEIRRFPRRDSTNGPPVKTHRKHGVYVTHAVRIAPSVPATIG